MPMGVPDLFGTPREDGPEGSVGSRGSSRKSNKSNKSNRSSVSAGSLREEMQQLRAQLAERDEQAQIMKAQIESLAGAMGTPLKKVGLDTGGGQKVALHQGCAAIEGSSSSSEDGAGGKAQTEIYGDRA